MVLGFLGFVCVNQRNLREIYWGFFCADRLSPLACYSPADSADNAEECSRLHYPAEKDRLFEVIAVIAILLFLGFVCVNLRDLRETSGVSFVQYSLSPLACYSPADYADYAERNAASCIITQRKTGCLRLRLFCCFVVCLRKSAGSAGESAVSFVLID